MGAKKNLTLVENKREMFNDLYYYHITGSVWEKVPWREKLINGRKNHAYAMVGKNMLIHGGINPTSTIIDETVMFNIENNKWEDATNIKNNLGWLAGHTFTTVFHSERKLHEHLISLKSLIELSEFVKSKKVIK